MPVRLTKSGKLQFLFHSFSRFIPSNVRQRKTKQHRVCFENLETRDLLSVNWADTFGGAGSDRAVDVAIGPDNSAYVVGGIQDGTTVDFDDASDDGEITTNGEGSKKWPTPSDGFLVKYDADGNFEWVIHTSNPAGNHISGVTVDSQGNAFVIGGFSGSVDVFRGDAYLTTITETTRRAGSEIFIAKVNGNGFVEWAHALGGSGNQYADSIAIVEDAATGQVDLFITGRALNAADLDPGPGDTPEVAIDGDWSHFVAKYQADSSTLSYDWARSLAHGYYGNLHEFSVSGDRIAAVGNTDNDLAFIDILNVADGAMLEHNLTSNAATRGGVTWVGTDLVVSGNFSGSVDIDGNGNIDLIGDDVRRGFIGRYSFDPSQPSGQRLRLEWASHLDSAAEYRLLDVKVAGGGTLYASGEFTETLSIGSGEIQSSGSRDGLVVALEPATGEFLTGVRLGGDSDYDQALILEVSPEGAIYTVGSTASSNATFPNVAGSYASAGGEDGFISVFTPLSSAPPVADAGPSQTGDEDQMLTFDASGSSDPDGDPLTYRWDFGDGETAETTSPAIMHAYAYGGMFDVTLTVLDGNGNATTDVTIATVTEINDVPQADSGGPYIGFATLLTAFDASASIDFDNADDTVGNDQTLQYIWDFGDGGTATTSSNTFEYAYSAAGLYDVTLTVSDGIASSTVTTTASIEAAPSGDPNTIYVWNIADAFETRQRGRNTDYRIVLDVFQDSDGDGIAELSDAGIAGVQVTVELRDSNGAVITSLTGQTDPDGVFRSDWIKGLVPGDYTAEVVDLALESFSWDPLLDVEDEQLLSVG